MLLGLENGAFRDIGVGFRRSSSKPENLTGGGGGGVGGGDEKLETNNGF